jgi:3-methylcrotonyl-CoA carboxylase beta subunit
MDSIGTPLKIDQIAQARYQKQKELQEKLATLAKRIEAGGGTERQAKIKASGKLTARERVAALIDSGSHFCEIGKFAAEGMYAEYGGAPAAGVITGIGRIAARPVVIVANDPSVKAGAWFPLTCKKNLRAQEIAMDNHLPIVYLVDSAGIFLPLQNDLFPDRDHFGRVFRNNARLSAMGIPQIAAIMGSCVAGGAYLPIMSDEALIVSGSGTVFLAGSHLVKAAIGETVAKEELGGASVHSEISGVTDYKMADDASALEKIRSLIGAIPAGRRGHFARQSSRLPRYQQSEIEYILPADPIRPYDMREIIARLVDDSEWDEYKAGYGKTMLCGYARLDGWSLGIVANQRLVSKSGSGEMQIGGVIYGDAADKAARFILNCNQRHIPLLFLQDVTGFMVGKKSEHSGILKDGAKLVNAVANSVVPKFTVLVGNSFGAGNYAMCGRSYDPRLLFSLPGSRIAVMGPEQAANTLLGIEIKRRTANGEEISEAERKELAQAITAKYEAELDPVYAAARLWVDAIISPQEIRQHISLGIEMADHSAPLPPLQTGVFQT